MQLKATLYRLAFVLARAVVVGGAPHESDAPVALGRIENDDEGTLYRAPQERRPVPRLGDGGDRPAPLFRPSQHGAPDSGHRAP